MSMTGLANRILKTVEQYPRQTPTLISKNLDTPVSTVNATLKVLSDLTLIEAKTRGLYEITRLGSLVVKRQSMR